MFDNNYAQYYELFNKDKNYKQEIEFVYDWARQPSKILDLGCGTAHYWKYYPKSVEAFGIEQSQAMIDKSIYKDRILCHSMDKAVYYGKFDLVTALFDALAYVDDHSFWKRLPVRRGGYYVFDLWDKDKVKKEGFRETVKTVGSITRTIKPIFQDWTHVSLLIIVKSSSFSFIEAHKMNLYEF